MRWARTWLCSLCVWLVACGPQPPWDLCGYEQGSDDIFPVVAEIEPKTDAPIFHWESELPVHQLRVSLDDGLADGPIDDVWVIEGEALGSPITYGEVPAGAVESVASRPLSSGAGYWLWGSRLVLDRDGVERACPVFLDSFEQP